MKQQDLFDKDKYEYLLIVSPPQEILDCIELFKSSIKVTDSKTNFKRAHLSVGHFIVGESHEENILLRLEVIMKNTTPFSLTYLKTELWNNNIHLVFIFDSEYFTNILIPKVKKTIGKNCASGIPHITILKNSSGLNDQYSLELPKDFRFSCNNIALLKRKFDVGDSYQVIKNFTLTATTT